MWPDRTGVLPQTKLRKPVLSYGFVSWLVVWEAVILTNLAYFSLARASFIRDFDSGESD
jgi:hypothetical protein